MSGHATVAFFVPHAGCPHACSFCDQRALSGAPQPPTPGEVCAVLRGALEQMGKRAAASEVAFFGGSFTAVAQEIRRPLLETAAGFVGPGGFAGIRVSTRPDAVSDEELQDLVRHGVTTIELGAQSMDDAVLAQNRRGHTAADVVAASRRIRRAGLRLGLQMMTGLPGDSDGGALETARQLAALRPDCVRIYPALVLRGTELARRYEAGAYRPQTLDRAVALGAKLLRYYDECGIPVIRFGLHDGPGLRESLLAGPHHPALRELCEGRLLLEEALGQLDGAQQGGTLLLRVHPRCVSRMTGQRRANLKELAARGFAARVLADETVAPMRVQVDRG